MDGFHFDTLTRIFSTAGSRRRALSGLLGSALGLLGTQTEQAAAKKKRPCPPCKKRKKGKCKATLPDGTVCGDGKTCQSGSCLAAVVPPPPGGCSSGQKPCDGGCIPSSQCCDNADCRLSGQVCTAGRQCTCPAALPEVCGGACLAPCFSPTSRDPNTCGCCLLGGARYVVSFQECCTKEARNDVCYGRPAGDSCSFHGQCASNNCLCGAFGCGCQ